MPTTKRVRAIFALIAAPIFTFGYHLWKESLEVGGIQQSDYYFGAAIALAVAAVIWITVRHVFRENSRS